MAGKKQDQNKQTAAKRTSTAAKDQDQSRKADHKKNEEKSTAKSESKDNSEALQKLDSLSEALQSDLSSINSDAVFEMVEDWYSLVHQSKMPEVKEIASGLKELKKLLRQDEVPGHDLGELLSQLGEQTNDAGSDAEKEFRAPLQRLGKQLAKIGRSLAKEEDQQHLEALDSIVDVLKQDPNTVDSESALGEIDRWYNLLHKSEDDSLKAIAHELKGLKQLLKGNKVKSADLSEKLIQLGEQTTEAASSAGKGFKGIIQKLGKALTRFGKSME